MLPEEEIVLIESFFWTVQWCYDNMLNVVRVFCQNVDVDWYNRTAKVGWVACPVRNTIVGYTTNAERDDCRRKLHRMCVSECNGMPYTIALAIGYPYTITANIDIEFGLVNGTLRPIEFLDENEMYDIDVEPESSTASLYTHTLDYC